MSVFAVTYDLHKPGNNYSDLIETIKGFGSYSHRFDSFWLVSSDTLNAADIRDALKDKVDNNDSVLVLKCSGTWASYNLAQGGVDWIKNQKF